MNQDGQFEFSNTPNPNRNGSLAGNGFESRTGYNRAGESPNGGIIGSALTPSQTNAAFTSQISSLATRNDAINPTAPIDNQPRVISPPNQPSQYPSANPTLTYGDILAEANNRSVSRKNLIPFLANKWLFIIGGAVIAIVILLIVLAATRTTPVSITDASSVNNNFNSLSALIQYGQNSITEQNLSNNLSEVDLVLTSAQNNLSTKVSGIAKSGSSSELDSSLQTKLTNAQATSSLNGTFYDQLQLEVTNTYASLAKLANDSKSADQQTLAKNYASNFRELLDRLKAIARPSN